MDSTDLKDIQMAIQLLWITFASQIIFLMQIGFVFVEAGSVRLKNLQNTLFKNILNICCASVCWWICGYYVAFKQLNGIVEQCVHIHFIYHWSLACTAVTIYQSSVCERMTMLGQIINTVFYILWIYPIQVKWTWGGGWLQLYQFQDYSGAGIIMMAGGVGGLAQNLITGPRLDRFNPSKIDDFKPNNITFTVLGSLILWFSWYGFASGAKLNSVIMNWEQMSLFGINTTLAAVGGAISSISYHYVKNRKFNNRLSNINVCNGFLSGLTSIIAGDNTYEPWASFLIGFINGLLINPVQNILINCKIDDANNSISVYGFSGIFGLLLYGVFNNNNGLIYSGQGYQILYQFVGTISICCWVFVNTILLMLVLKYFKLHRQSEQIEKYGSDEILFGCGAYNHDNITIKAMKLLKEAEENGIIKRIVQETINPQIKRFLKGLDE